MPEPFEGRCFSCKEKVTVERGRYTETPRSGNGAKQSGSRGMMRGPCPWCGNTVFKFVQRRTNAAAD